MGKIHDEMIEDMREQENLSQAIDVLDNGQHCVLSCEEYCGIVTSKEVMEQIKEVLLNRIFELDKKWKKRNNTIMETCECRYDGKGDITSQIIHDYVDKCRNLGSGERLEIKDHD